MERTENFKFTVSEKSMRLDQYLASQLDDFSRSYIQKLIENENVKVNNSICRVKKEKVSAGDEVEITVPEPVELSIEPENIPLDIVYEDDDVLVVNKPKGMVVHPAAGNYTGTLVNAIMYHCGDRLSSINGVVRPGIVHRIDKDTSGLLMIAKTDRAHESLSAQLAEHSVTRKYYALVYHNIKDDEGIVNLPIGRDPRNRLRMAVTYENSKKAVTHYKVLERFGKYTLLQLILETGRTHQIRVHMSYLKHPLVGDMVYGPKKQTLPVTGQMLHAKVIGFVHPVTKEYMEFDSELPEYFNDILTKLRKET